MDGGEKPLKLYNLITKDHPRIRRYVQSERHEGIVKRNGPVEEIGVY